VSGHAVHICSGLSSATCAPRAGASCAFTSAPDGGANYSNAELAEWAARLGEWREKEEPWIYFNNDWSAFAIKNALRLRKLLEERAADA